MGGKSEYKFYSVICNGYNRPKAIEFDVGETEMWKKIITLNIGATRIEEESNVFGLKSDIVSSIVSEQMLLLVNGKLLVWEHITSVRFGKKYCAFWKTGW